MAAIPSRPMKKCRTPGLWSARGLHLLKDAKARARPGSRPSGLKQNSFPTSLTDSWRRRCAGRPGSNQPSGMVEQLRLIKDADEISQIRASVLLAASLFQTALSVIKPGVAETQVAGELELQARRAGAEKMSFDTIVAAGPRSALAAWACIRASHSCPRIYNPGLRCYTRRLLF